MIDTRNRIKHTLNSFVPATQRFNKTGLRRSYVDVLLEEASKRETKDSILTPFSLPTLSLICQRLILKKSLILNNRFKKKKKNHLNARPPRLQSRAIYVNLDPCTRDVNKVEALIGIGLAYLAPYYTTHTLKSSRGRKGVVAKRGRGGKHRVKLRNVSSSHSFLLQGIQINSIVPAILLECFETSHPMSRPRD